MKLIEGPKPRTFLEIEEYKKKTVLVSKGYDNHFARSFAYEKEIGLNTEEVPRVITLRSIMNALSLITGETYHFDDETYQRNTNIREFELLNIFTLHDADMNPLAHITNHEKYKAYSIGFKKPEITPNGKLNIKKVYQSSTMLIEDIEIGLEELFITYPALGYLMDEIYAKVRTKEKPLTNEEIINIMRELLSLVCFEKKSMSNDEVIALYIECCTPVKKASRKKGRV